MTDQLSLRLEPGLPNLPALQPMLPKPASEPFDSPDHLFEPAWGGVRALAYVGPAEAVGLGVVRFMGPDGDPIGAPLPELRGMAARLAARSAILDGELVVVDSHGRADGPGLEARLAGRSGRPVAYLAYDLLHLDGRSMLGRPLVRRLEALRRVLRPGDEVLAVPAFAAEGRALFDAAAAQGIAGIMARQRTSPYLPGVRSRLWRFVPCEPAVVPEALDDAVESGRAAGDPDLDPPPTRTVMALIARLPLPVDDLE